MTDACRYHRAEAARAYVRCLRNEKKHDYALRYLAWRMFPHLHNEPDSPTGLSYMAAQAVRMTLTELLKD
jgi:hypothetical protein